MRIDMDRAQREFSATMRKYAGVSGKVETVALNKCAKDVCMLAMKEAKSITKKPADLRAELEKNGLAYRIVRKSKGSGLKRKELDKLAKKLISAKIRTIGYIRAGFFNAARAFGLRSPSPRPGKSAAGGEGKRATGSRKVAEISNTSFEASTLTGDGFARAIQKKSSDMMVYIMRKMGKNWEK